MNPINEQTQTTRLALPKGCRWKSGSDSEYSSFGFGNSRTNGLRVSSSTVLRSFLDRSGEFPRLLRANVLVRSDRPIRGGPVHRPVQLRLEAVGRSWPDAQIELIELA
jgi:hypothetical protein